MNDEKKGGPKTAEKTVTPISPAVARQLMKNQMKAEFASRKPEERALAVEAMNEILIEEARATMEAKKALEEQIEDLPQYTEKEQTRFSKFKGVLGTEASGFSEEPVRYLISKLISKWLVGPVAAVSAITTGAQMYANPESRNFVHMIKGPFQAAWEMASYAGGFVYDNSTAVIIGATAALGLSILKRPTWKKRVRRLFYAGAVFTTPQVFSDLVDNLQKGAKTLAETTSITTTGLILTGASVLALVVSWFLSDEVKHDEEKETSSKEPAPTEEVEASVESSEEHEDMPEEAAAPDPEPEERVEEAEESERGDILIPLDE